MQDLRSSGIREGSEASRSLFSKVLRFIFFVLILRPLLIIFLGVNFRRWKNIPQKGPAIIVANHNSHLDTLILMSYAFSVTALPSVRPVAAADYWTERGALLRWFAINIIHVIPVKRRTQTTQAQTSLLPTAAPHTQGDPLEGVSRALKEGSIIIFFPEGTRGPPELMQKFKKGIAYLAEKHSEVPVVPVFLHGLGKILPRGDCLPVPFFIDAFVGEKMFCQGNRDEFLEGLEKRMHQLQQEGNFLEFRQTDEPSLQ